MNTQQQEIYSILLELLHSIRNGDTETYVRLSDKDLTCIEPETGGNIVRGLPFHLFLIERSKSSDHHLEVINPEIRVLGNTAYAAYTLATSKWVGDSAIFSQVQETRIFHLQENSWKMVHFHRSQ